MKANVLEQEIRNYTGMIIPSHRFYSWEEEGLLGKVGRTEGEQRDYSEKNANRAVLVTMLRTAHWSLNKIKDLLVNRNPVLKEELIAIVSDFEFKALPKLRELIKDLDSLLKEE